MNKQESNFQPSMLISFCAQNTRSFRDELEWSLEATALAEKQYVREIPWREGGRLARVLPVAGVFGANASGKSNLLKVLMDMHNYVRWSFRHRNHESLISRKPFLLDPQVAKQPTKFEIAVVIKGILHEYGFELDAERILKEWAYRYPKGRAALIFTRDGDDVRPGAANRRDSRTVQQMLQPNALFLSTAAAIKHPALLPLYNWFDDNLLLADVVSRPLWQAFSVDLLSEEKTRERVLELLQAADLGITDARKRELDPAIKEWLRQGYKIMLQGSETKSGNDDYLNFLELGTRVRMSHRGVELELEDESVGTQVWFGLVGLVVDALGSGNTLLVDELDASLHPLLIKELVLLFQDPETNPRHAQLLFNTHAVSLLGDTADDRVLGRDQIWFTEKSNEGVTRLYSLDEYQPRKHEAIRNRYLRGRYGAVPILSSPEFEAAVTQYAMSKVELSSK